MNHPCRIDREVATLHETIPNKRYQTQSIQYLNWLQFWSSIEALLPAAANNTVHDELSSRLNVHEKTKRLNILTPALANPLDEERKYHEAFGTDRLETIYPSPFSTGILVGR